MHLALYPHELDALPNTRAIRATIEHTAREVAAVLEEDIAALQSDLDDARRTIADLYATLRDAAALVDTLMAALAREEPGLSRSNTRAAQSEAEAIGYCLERNAADFERANA